MKPQIQQSIKRLREAMLRVTNDYGTQGIGQDQKANLWQAFHILQIHLNQHCK